MLRPTATPTPAGLVTFAAALLALTLTLQGCGTSEECPDMVPITNGKVKMKCEGETCDEVDVKCDSGCGYGVQVADAGAQMQFTINTVEHCVIKFTKEPPYCHKCANNGDTITADGTSTKLTVKEGAKAGGACGTLTYKCDDGKTGDLANGADYTCEESEKTESPCLFYVKFTETNPCSNTTKVKTAKVKDAPVKPKATEDAPTTNLASKEKPEKAQEKPKPNALVSVDEQIVSSDGHMVDAHLHHAAHVHHEGGVQSHYRHRITEHDDDDLPELEKVRPWVLDTHAAHSEQQ